MMTCPVSSFAFMVAMDFFSIRCGVLLACFQDFSTIGTEKNVLLIFKSILALDGGSAVPADFAFHRLFSGLVICYGCFFNSPWCCFIFCERENGTEAAPPPPLPVQPDCSDCQLVLLSVNREPRDGGEANIADKDRVIGSLPPSGNFPNRRKDVSDFIPFDRIPVKEVFLFRRIGRGQCQPKLITRGVGFDDGPAVSDPFPIGQTGRLEIGILALFFEAIVDGCAVIGSDCGIIAAG